MGEASSFRFAYQVFLSFRGEDTRKTFTDHLYTALTEAGIHTFRDDDEIERGEDVSSELEKAIRQSKVAVIVFSADYASSRWCLDELVMINKLRTVGAMRMLPIFYRVDPSQLRKLTGSYGEAFVRHRERFKEEIDRVERWRKTLEEVADLSGIVLKDEHEGQFIRDVIKHVWDMLDCKLLFVEPHLVGIDCYVQEINRWLPDFSTNVRMLTVHGIGGVGKTTIAKTVYNENYGKFEGGCFLANVRETSEQPNGLLRLQKQLLSQILKGKSNKIYNVDEGTIQIKNAICCKRVLIVLDDVSNFVQFNAIICMKEWLSSGSKIIITTRYKSVFNDQEDCWTVHVEPLGDNNSLQLFSFHAFGQDHPHKDYIELSKCVVSHCGGLPLALRVIGSSLSGGKSIELWKSAIQEIQTIPDYQILKMLRMSFDSLQNDSHKNLFLHIACFFVGMDKDVVVEILDDCGFHTNIGIQRLIDASLIEINERKKLGMHQLLRDMGREIIRQESLDEPGERSRLWNPEEAFGVLTEKAGTRKVKGLILDMHCYGSAFRKSMPAHHKNCHRLGFFSLFINYISKASSTSSAYVIKTEAFANMPKLKLLQLNNVEVEGRYEDFPKHLVWLCWHGFALKSIPSSFDLKKLVVLEMRNSHLEHVWQESLYFPQLKILDLSHSHLLTKTPDFKGLPSLERLKLKDCIKLEEIDESIGVLEGLVLLNLKGCKKLRKVPKLIGSLRSLQKLVLIGCSELQELPEELPEMESLVVLGVDEFTINQSSCTWRNARKLGWLFSIKSWLTGKEHPETSKFSFALLPYSLKFLNLSNCNLVEDDFPQDLSFFAQLKYLNLSGNPITTLPESITKIPMLVLLVLDQCSNLRTLPKFRYLGGLSLRNCRSLIYLPELPTTEYVDLFGCQNVHEVKCRFKLRPIEENDIKIINMVRLCNLESLDSHGLEMISCVARKKIKTPIQARVLYESSGIFTLFLSGCEIPSWYSHQEEGSSLSFSFRCSPGSKFIGFNLCTLYKLEKDVDLHDPFLYSPIARIDNKTKGVRWFYSPPFYAHNVNVNLERSLNKPELNEDMLWFSHWKFEGTFKFNNLKFEDGDHVKVEVFMPPGLWVKRFGIHAVYDQEMNGSQSISKSPCYQKLDRVTMPRFLQDDLQSAAGNFLYCNSGVYREVNYSAYYPFNKFVGWVWLWENHSISGKMHGDPTFISMFSSNLSLVVCPSNKLFSIFMLSFFSNFF